MLLSDFGNSSSDPVYKLTEEMFVDNGMQLGHTVNIFYHCFLGSSKDTFSTRVVLYMYVMPLMCSSTAFQY